MGTTDESLERRQKALELHLAGASYDAVAAGCGYASRSGAYKAVQEGLAALGEAPAESEAVATELARLDAMLTGLWGKARRGDVQAVDRVLRISERRTQLLLAGRAAAADEPKGTALDEFTKRRLESAPAAGKPQPKKRAK